MKTIKQKDKGKDVEKLQTLLKARGFYQGDVDGHFGPKTKAVVVQFQKASGLEADGVVGQKTWKALLEKTESQKTPPQKTPPPNQTAALATYRYLGPNTANQNRATIIDEETALWFARMCIGEGGKNCTAKKAAAMLWAIMNRWMLHPGRKHWPTYLYLLRRFSQPINPRWQKGGDLAKKHAGTEHATPARLRRRAQICALEWGDIPERIAETVRAFQRGTLPPPVELRELDRRNRTAGYTLRHFNQIS